MIARRAYAGLSARRGMISDADADQQRSVLRG